MNSKIKYFDKDVWVSETSFHYHGHDLPLNKIETIRINFRVNTIIASAFAFLISLIAMAYCYFNFGKWSYLCLLPLITSFGMTRHAINNYVELIVQIDGKTIKTITASIHNRHWVYEVEEYICECNGLKMPHGSGKK